MLKHNNIRKQKEKIVYICSLAKKQNFLKTHDLLSDNTNTDNMDRLISHL